MDRYNEPTLADVIRDLWRARLALSLGALAGLCAALLFLALAVPQYKATMLVAPTVHSGAPDIASLFPENSGSAVQYVLQSFNPGDSSDFMRFEAILREPSVAEKLLQDPSVRQGLAQARRWAFLPAPALDTPPKLAAWLQDHVDIEPVGATRLRRVTFRHPDPVFAATLLRTMYAATDDLIRSGLEKQTTERIAYLNKTIDQTLNPDHRRDLTKLLMDQEQIALILAVHEPFAASLAEPPATAPKADWPRKAVVIPAFMLAGLVLAYFIRGLRRPSDAG